MQAKDFLTFFSLLVSVLSFLLALRSARKADLAKVEAAAATARAGVVEAISRKNEILNEYFRVMNLMAEYRFYNEQVSRLLEIVAEDDPIGHSMKDLMRWNLEHLIAEEKRTKESIDKVKALDPKEIATNPKAREMLEDLHGRPQQLTIKLTGMVEQIKMKLGELQPSVRRAQMSEARRGEGRA